MNFPGEFTVTVVSTTTSPENDLGDTTAATTATRVGRVLYAPRGSQERTDPQQPTVYSAASLYFLAGLPAGMVLDSDDAIVLEGVHPMVDGTYQVEGMPGYWNGQLEVPVTRTGGV